MRGYNAIGENSSDDLATKRVKPSVSPGHDVVVGRVAAGRGRKLVRWVKATRSACSYKSRSGITLPRRGYQVGPCYYRETDDSGRY